MDCRGIRGRKDIIESRHSTGQKCALRHDRLEYGDTVYSVA